MLSTDLSPILVGFVALVTVFACFCCFYVMRLGAYCRNAVEYVTNQNKNAVSLRKMAEVEATLTDLTDSYEAILSSHKKLRSRIGMRKVREERANGHDLDPSAQADADKAATKRRLRLEMKQKGILR